ncbi:MAG TPA: carboxypeptidase-like regulatory domain-containing protein [Chitinispirillaceae bacterium]|nr:carboxypeptidase-like regulatory domain-containing protein [Chitinispirillaceae bacterium]
MKFRINHLCLFFLPCLFSLVLTCSMGGSTEQGNARICGSIHNPSSVKARTELQLVSEQFIPSDASSGAVFKTKTDSLGNYSFENIPLGSYYLYAYDSCHQNVILNGPYDFISDQTSMGRDTLKKSSMVSIMLLDSLVGNTITFFVKGTTDTVLSGNKASVSLRGVPCGTHDIMYCLPYNNFKPSIYAEKVTISPADTISISYQNRPPQIITRASDLPSFVKTDTTYTGYIKATDPDSDNVSFLVTNSPEFFNLDTLTGKYNWTPNLSDTSNTSIKILVIDSYGASNSIIWKFRIKTNQATPTPLTLSGSQICSLDSTYTYLTDSLLCSSSPSLYRFFWGEYDTSNWSQSPTIKHTWLKAGTFSIRVQVKCNDFGLPSSWSSPKSVQVNKTRISDIPQLLTASDTFYSADPVTIVVDSQTCESNVLYKLIVNGSDYSGWYSNRAMMFSPKYGTYAIRVVGWCDTSNSFPSAQSEPCTLTFVSGQTPSPYIFGDSTYDNEHKTLDYKITENTTLSGNDTLLYRISICTYDTTEYSENSGTLLAIYSKLNMADTLQLFSGGFCDTTQWLKCDQLRLNLYSLPSDYIELRAQAKLSTSGLISDWTVFRIRKNFIQ